MDKSPSYVRHILDISTAHVSEGTAGQLDIAAGASTFSLPVCYAKGEYGWRIAPCSRVASLARLC